MSIQLISARQWGTWIQNEGHPVDDSFKAIFVDG